MDVSWHVVYTERGRAPTYMMSTHIHDVQSHRLQVAHGLQRAQTEPGVTTHTSLQGAVPFRVSSLLVVSVSSWNLLTNTYLLVGNGLDG